MSGADPRPAVQYENPEIPEGINTSKDHPLKELVWLVVGLILVSLLVMAVLAFMARLLVPLVPFSYEQEIAAVFVDRLDDADGPVAQYLQALADELSLSLDLPAGMSVQMHYMDDDPVNAYATLGGHIVVFRGLLEAMPSENALAMVVAHEIAHIKHRDPIEALGRGVLLGVVWSVVTGTSGSDTGGRVLGETGLLTLLSFSRAQERAADQEAIRAVEKRYGHIAGAGALFERLEKEQPGSDSPVLEFFSSHPRSQDRSADIERLAGASGWWTEGEVTPLPGFVGALSGPTEPD